jgi:hypothetical protein
MRLWIKRVDRDNELIANIEREVKSFLAELDAKLAELAKLFGPLKKDVAA